MWLCNWHAVFSSVVAVGVFTLLVLKPVVLRSWFPEVWIWGLGAIGGLGLIAFTGGGVYASRVEESVPIHSQAVYDVATSPSSVLAMTTGEGRGVVLFDGFKRTIEETNGPQRVVYDTENARFLFANYWDMDGKAITSVDEKGEWTLELPECLQAIDVAVIGETGFVICEYTQNLVVFRPSDGKRLRVWWMGLLPYAVATDTVRRRAYTTQEFGPITAFDGNGGFLRSRLTGLGAFGVAVDEKTGTVWVARFLSGEVVALAPDLTVLARVPVGCAPRDLAIDAERRLLIAGNYFEGTVAVVDLDRRTRVSKFRVGSLSILPLLRGVSVTPRGEWLISQRNGVHRFRPE